MMPNPERDTVKRFILLLLLQAQADHASELIISSSSSAGAELKYKVGDTWHDVSPPPPHIIPQALTELASMAGLRGEALPAEGTIDVPLSGTRLCWRIRLSATGANCFPFLPDNLGRQPWS
jgi:type II secretory ATPase GspE/PulE/Tfp pilus assembly ATPase PilB-like protein